MQSLLVGFMHDEYKIANPTFTKPINLPNIYLKCHVKYSIQTRKQL